MKFARMVASSVSGLCVYTHTAIKHTITALITMARPRFLPMVLRSRLVRKSRAPAIKLTPEKEQPGTQGEQHPETKIHQGQNAKVRFDFRPNEDSAHHQRSDNPEGHAQHPGRKE